jgi:hypothetical protein
VRDGRWCRRRADPLDCAASVDVGQHPGRALLTPAGGVVAKCLRVGSFRFRHEPHRTALSRRFALVRVSSFIAGLIAIIGGATLVGLGSSKSDDSVIQAGGATLVAGLALAGVAAGISTWRDERRLAIEKERQEATGVLVYQLMARFAGVPWDPRVEAELRSKVAVWGDVEVVEKLRAWNETYIKHVPKEVPPDTTFALSADASAEFRRATGEVAHAVRKQFDPHDKATVEQLVGALFNVPGAKSPSA